MGVVAKRSSMTFFSNATCQFCHRVRIVLAEKGVTVEIVDVDLNDKPQELLELNPYGTVPTLLDRDLALYESKVMMEYLDERFPHPPLLPVYPVARAESRQLMYRIERDWAPLISVIQTHEDPKVAELARKRLREGLLSTAPVFGELDYFMSEELTLVDCCMAPILWRLPLLGIDLGEGKSAELLQGYMTRLFERESFQNSLSDLEKEMRDL
ncbi:glutathione S-transferase N-terminal domain-containing protein [Umboniibacter marinipuniceus]|uniref:RNA polymerase-associated protein n=1 Tax=Umboniibacter marinipuniceus TaxID=569599 RepID=A0A3M0A4A2_9GAMM|nr:glutathione S-transferase N-terminal domain-containing protein [Umboniibacter marinipuniceus]RMA79487.1 RNA polymerase-associated protein [Umboniibacter marinipuniceus]